MQQLNEIINGWHKTKAASDRSGDGPVYRPLRDACVAAIAAGTAAMVTAPLDKVKVRYASMRSR